jgi:hypothetical protein
LAWLKTYIHTCIQHWLPFHPAHIQTLDGSHHSYTHMHSTNTIQSRWTN